MSEKRLYNTLFFPAVGFIALSTSCICACVHTMYIFLSKDLGYWTDSIITPHTLSNSYYTSSTEGFFGSCLPQQNIFFLFSRIQ